MLAKRFGAAVIALTIDESRHGEDRRATSCAIARRLVDFACNRHGLAQSDLLIDPLTFTIATGNEDDRKLAQWTLEGIARDPRRVPRHPDHPRAVQHQLRAEPGGARGAELGVSRPRAARRHDRRDRARVEDPAAAPDRRPEEVQVAEDLIFDRRREGYDPLQRLLELFAGPQGRRCTVKKSAPKRSRAA